MLPSAVVTVNVDGTNMTMEPRRRQTNNSAKKATATVVVTQHPYHHRNTVDWCGSPPHALPSIAALLFMGGIVMLRVPIKQRLANVRQ